MLLSESCKLRRKEGSNGWACEWLSWVKIWIYHQHVSEMAQMACLIVAAWKLSLRPDKFIPRIKQLLVWLRGMTPAHAGVGPMANCARRAGGWFPVFLTRFLTHPNSSSLAGEQPCAQQCNSSSSPSLHFGTPSDVDLASTANFVLRLRTPNLIEEMETWD